MVGYLPQNLIDLINVFTIKSIDENDPIVINVVF